MYQYWILFVLVFILLSVIRGRKKTWPLFLSIALIFVFFAFREGFTPDYDEYLEQFSSLRGSGLWTDGRHSSELLYQAMVIYLPYRLALVIQAGLFCIALYYTFKSIPYNYWWFCVFLLFFIRIFLIGNMGGFRSCFVTTCFFFAIKSRDYYGIKKGSIIGLILIIISSLIHKSGWVMIPLYLLIGPQPLSLNKKTIWIVGSIIFVFISYFFAGWLNDTFNTFFQDNEDLETYLRTDLEDGIKIGTFTILRIAMLLYLLFVTLTFTARKDLNIIEMTSIKLTVVFILLTIMPDIALKDRFCYYLSLPTLIGATTVIKKDHSIKKDFYLGAWLLFAFWEYYLFVGKLTYVLFYSHYHNILFDLI